ncbi:gelsolin-related protein of 125 kDa-like [Triticum urartu]|uniref:gelsolin-related protein of 125 kDa-like n=1 Tax=Triticum urartu TaxID=4572 RepID=UPI002044CDA3|nr:gelsolin-related protein of 125 kDa-like [Triticum urartu]XP_048553889.1 gelsolin-related protein of 125 kDa-like [Triticum urartu]
MGCGGSKEDVATGNTAANGAGKLFRRKSTMSASHRSSHAPSPSSSDDTSVAVKDVAKEPSAGETKADVVEVASDEKPVAVVEDEEEAVAAKKDVTGDEVSATVDEAAQPPLKEEGGLPKSNMADEAPVVEEAKVDEAKEAVVALIKEETKPEETKEEETSPASTNDRGTSRTNLNLASIQIVI